MRTIASSQEVVIAADRVRLPGTLTLPEGAIGTVIFAHGSGSSRMSPRNLAVAQSLVDRGCGTLLFDLLTPNEANDRRNVFDIDLLAKRMVAAAKWMREQGKLAHDLPIGFFGASTGAAASLVAAAELSGEVSGVVSRGGRPDLAGSALQLVEAPTLLIVGSLDHEVIELNRQAQRQLRCVNQLVIVPDASHLFEEPGTLEKVARLAGEWFVEHFQD